MDVKPPAAVPLLGEKRRLEIRNRTDTAGPRKEPVMGDEAMLHNYLILGAILFALGLVGFVVRRNMIVMFLCAEMMLQGVSLNLIGWGRYHGSQGLPGARRAGH